MALYRKGKKVVDASGKIVGKIVRQGGAVSNFFSRFNPFNWGSKSEPAYDTGSQGRRLRGWRVAATGPNTMIRSGLDLIRHRSRDLTRKFPLMNGAYDTIVANIVGTGIRALSKAQSTADRANIHDVWEIWERQCDVEGINHFRALQELAVRQRYEAGEVFIRLIVNDDPDLLVPLKIQLLEAEHVPTDLNEALSGGNSIIGGVEFDPGGKRVAYHVYPNHPNDDILATILMETVRVPANEIIHYFKPLRPGQVRGLPECFAAQAKARDLMIYNEAELVKKQTASLMVGTVTSPLPEGLLGEDNTDPDAGPGEAVAKVEPGSLLYLEPGEDIKWNNPVESGASYEPFLKFNYREMATSLNISYEELTGDTTGISFSSIRAVLNQSQRKYRKEQVRFEDMVLYRIRDKFFETAILSGALEFPNYLDRPRQYNRVAFQAPGWKYVNPLQEVQAKKEEIKAGFRSREQIIAEDGFDIEEVDAQIARDKKRAQDLGLAFDIDIQPVQTQVTQPKTEDSAQKIEVE